MTDFYCLLSPQTTSSSAAAAASGGNKKKLNSWSLRFLVVRLSECESIQTFWWRQEHFVPGAQKIHLSVGAGVHRVDERQCLPIVHSKLWRLRGFSCSGPLFDTHVAGGMPLEGGQELHFLFPLRADLQNISYFPPSKHFSQDSHMRIKTSRWFELFTGQSTILGTWKNVWIQHPGSVKKMCLLMLRDVCRAGWKACEAGPETWAWGGLCPTTEQQSRGGKGGKRIRRSTTRTCLPSAAG